MTRSFAGARGCLVRWTPCMDTWTGDRPQAHNSGRDKSGLDIDTGPQKGGAMQEQKQLADWAGTFGESTQSVRALAMQTLFERMEALCEGAIAVDSDARVVWINEKYAHKLGLQNSEQALGAPVEDIIPNSQMREVARTGEPIVLDLMEFGNEHLVVTRLPLRDEGGRLLGAIGFVLYDRVENLKPLMSKYNKLQARLAATERELAQTRRAKYTLASFLGISCAATEIKRQARRAAQLDATVLPSGETGTGKELVAHAIP